MGIIIVFAIAAGMAAFAISIGIVAASLGFAVGALKTGTSRNLSKTDLGILVLMSLAFFALVFIFLKAQAFGPGTFWEKAILGYLVFIITALALSAVAIMLRVFRHLSGSKNDGKPANTLVSATVILFGFGVSYSAVAMTGDFFLFKVKKAPPLELVLDGPPTHCVYATSGINFYEIRSAMSKQLFRLKQGEKLQLNTTSRKAGEGWVRFAIRDGDKRIIAYAIGSGIVALKNDGNCVLPK